MLTIRPEAREDGPAVREVNERAFQRAAEADLTDALRRTVRPHLSLVAEEGGRIVGHIFFSPVEIDPGGDAVAVMALAPMAVIPERQRQGIGSALVRKGLEACRQMGSRAVVVLGHPEYYPRFGFQPAEAFGLQSTYDVPAEAFMAIELLPGALDKVHGAVRYPEPFKAVE